jgi:hypothetical protein
MRDPAMAPGLIRQWRLAVLRVQLDLADRPPTVKVSLAGYPQDTARTFWTQLYPLSAFGLDVVPPTTLVVPPDLRDRVAGTLAANLQSEAALWLRLVPPYGYLGAVPWEASLVEATNLPVLRVPDRLPAASDLGRIWRAVIAVNAAPRFSRAAPNIRPHSAASYVSSLVKRLGTVVGGEVEIDVFADAGTANALRRQGLPEPWVHLHNPEHAEELSRNRSTHMPDTSTGGVRGRTYAGSVPTGRAWADWIMAGLAGRAVRALHIVLDGVLDLDRPRLTLSPDPKKPVAGSKCVFVTGEGVQRVADAIGAATLSFGSASPNPSDLAIRMIADEIGQQRSGATIYSSIAEDPKGDALAQAYAFLADRSRELPIPLHPSLFMYAQPEQVRSALRQPLPMSQSIAASPGDEVGILPGPVAHPGSEILSDLAVTYSAEASVPTWVAASDRYLNSQWAGLATSATSPAATAYSQGAYKNVQGAYEISQGAYDRGATEALGELGQIVSRHARPS